MDQTVAAFLGTLALVIIQGVAVAFWAGGIHQKVRGLEADVKPIAGMSSELAVFKERMDTLIKLLEDADVTPRRRGRHAAAD